MNETWYLLIHTSGFFFSLGRISPRDLAVQNNFCWYNLLFFYNNVANPLKHISYIVYKLSFNENYRLCFRLLFERRIDPIRVRGLERERERGAHAHPCIVAVRNDYDSSLGRHHLDNGTAAHVTMPSQPLTTRPTSIIMATGQQNTKGMSGYPIGFVTNDTRSGRFHLT